MLVLTKKRTILNAILLVLIANPMTVNAQTVKNFSISYDAQLSLDKKRATETGMSSSMINALTSVMGNSVSIAEVVDTVSINKNTYHIQSMGTLTRLVSVFMAKGTFIRISEGQMTENVPNTLRYVDVRTSNPPLTTLVDEKKKSIYFYNGKIITNTIPYQNKIQDVLSVGYGFIGKLPSRPVTMSMSDGKSIKEATFDISKETLELFAKKIETIKLTRRLSSKDDASVEYWLRSTDGLPVRVRIGMSQRYGAVLDLTAMKIVDK